MKTRWISLLLCALLVGSLFAGCGGDNALTGDTAATPSSDGGTTADPGSQPSSEEGTAEAVEAEGYTLPLTDEPVTLSIAVVENGYAPASFANNLAIFEEYERITGVKLDWQVYPGSEYDQAMTTRLAAASDLPDMFKIPNNDNNIGTVVRLANEEIIVPIDSYIEQYATNIMNFYELYPDMRSGTTLDNGRIYTLPYSYYEQRTLKVPVIAIRQDWLDALELEVPVTIEDWEEVLTAFKDGDPNGNGQADEIPLATRYLKNIDGGGMGVFANAWGLRYGASSLGKRIVDGQVVYDQVTPAFKEYLTWMNSLYEKGLIHPDVFFRQDEQTFDQLISNDSLGVTVGMVGAIPTWNSVASTNEGTEANYIPVLPPQNINTGEQYLEIQNGILFHFAVSKDCENPDIAVKWLDYFYASEDGRRMAHWGIEGETYEMVDGKPQFTSLVTENPDGLDILSVLRSYGGFNNFLMFRDLDFMKAVSQPVEIEFSDNNKSKFVEPFPSLVPTSDEARQLASIMADIDPYEEEMVTKFIMGLEPLDNFDTYVDTMNALGLEEAIILWQRQYDRAVS